MRLRSFLFLFLLICFSFRVYSQTQQLKLKQCIDSAKQNLPSLQLASANRDEAKNMAPSRNFSSEFSVKNGYLYNDQKGTELNLRQYADWPGNWQLQNRYSSTYSELASAQYNLEEKQVFATVKSAYYNALGAHLKLSMINNLLSEMMEAVKNDTSWLFNDTILDADYMALHDMLAQWQLKKEMAYDELIIADTKLKNASGLKLETEPMDSTIQMYELEPIPSGNTRAPANLLKTVEKTKIKANDIKMKMSKNEALPSFFVGYKYLNVSGSNGLHAWEAGIRVPIFSGKTKDAKAQQKINLLQSEKAMLEIQTEVDELLARMNQCFDRINFYYDFGRQQARKYNEAARQYIVRNGKADINYMNLLVKREQYYFDYIEALNLYNQYAIRFEVYAY
jgi:cobalt-zinc-cadmium resistance protein CzcA